MPELHFLPYRACLGARVLFCFWLVLSAVPAPAATWHVWTNSPANGPGTDWSNAFHDIQSAVDAATNAGDVVLVTNGTYRLASQIMITNGIVVRSVEGSEVTVVDGNDATRCFCLSASNAVVEGLTITRGMAANTNGGGVYIAAQGTVSESVIRGNSAANDGGGIYCGGGGMITQSVITNNTAGDDGGGVCLAGGGVLVGSVVVSNVAMGDGGGVSVSTEGIVDACDITGNSSGKDGVVCTAPPPR
jgi:predicted outer membrane repeat protein